MSQSPDMLEKGSMLLKKWHVTKRLFSRTLCERGPMLNLCLKRQLQLIALYVKTNQRQQSMGFKSCTFADSCFYSPKSPFNEQESMKCPNLESTGLGFFLFHLKRDALGKPRDECVMISK